jgi:hypothetical protein
MIGFIENRFESGSGEEFVNQTAFPRRITECNYLIG